MTHWKNYLFFVTILLLGQQSIGQEMHRPKTDSLKTMVVGKWLLVKNTQTYDDATQIRDSLFFLYDFLVDGTFKMSIPKKYGDSTIYQGNWLIRTYHDKSYKAFYFIDLSNVKPYDRNCISHMRENTWTWGIIEVTSKELITHCGGDGDWGNLFIGKNEYIKQ